LKGYASESAAAVLAYGGEQFGLSRIVAIVAPHNDASVRVLKRLGFQFERMADAGTQLYAHQSPGQGPVD
jgi:RimJ/RimL family protein N-acetyltransferase